MKALKLVEAQHYEVVEAPEPQQDGAHVIIKVEKVGICGSDLTIWRFGKDCIFGDGKIMGHEFVGVVTDPGPRTDLKVGDRVVGCPANYCGHCFFCDRGLENLCYDADRYGGPGVTIDGACSPYFAIVADRAFKIRDDLDTRVAALVEPIANGHHAVARANVQPGDKVLITGGGIIAILCAWWARKMGASYIVMSEINPARIEHLKQYSAADEVVNLTEAGAMEALAAKIGLGFDVAFECSHPSEDLINNTLVPLVRKGAVITQVGSIDGTLSFNFFPVQYKELSYLTCWSINEADFKAAIQAAEECPEEFLPHITDVVPMSKAQEKVLELTSGKSKDVKVMIDPQQ